MACVVIEALGPARQRRIPQEQLLMRDPTGSANKRMDADGGDGRRVALAVVAAGHPSRYLR